MAVFAGNHGVTRHGISPRPVAATANAVELCAAGGAAINTAIFLFAPVYEAWGKPVPKEWMREGADTR